MSKFSEHWVMIRDSFEDFISKGLHGIVDALHPLIKQVGSDLAAALPEIGAAALAAALDQKHNGSEAAYQAAKNAAVIKAKEIGVQETESLGISLRAAALNAAAQAKQE